MPERRSRSRLHRDPQLAALELQPRDLVVLRDLYYFRFAAAPALYLSAAWASNGKGMAYFAKRLTQLWRAGYISRFHAGYSRYLRGSRHFLYTIESGKAAGAARTGRRPEDIDSDIWRGILRESTAVQERVREALLACGFAFREINRVLHNNTELAMKFYTGESSGVRHHVLAAEFLSRFWFEARMRGESVEDIQPDGIADLSFRDPQSHRHRDLVRSDGIVPIKPDCLFTIGDTRYALEAETGTSSAAKVCLKVRRYARCFDVFEACSNTTPNLQLIALCQARSHADLVRAVVDNHVPPSTASRVFIETPPARSESVQCLRVSSP